MVPEPKTTRGDAEEDDNDEMWCGDVDEPAECDAAVRDAGARLLPDLAEDTGAAGEDATKDGGASGSGVVTGLTTAAEGVFLAGFVSVVRSRLGSVGTVEVGRGVLMTWLTPMAWC